jgi:ubiquinone/menaquinone biosynthesis C-methylase UbiE
MSVAKHLNIKLSEYDRSIRTFIPNYEEMLEEAAKTASLVGKRQPAILDLGIGTGALSARCLAMMPHANISGIDADPDILELARRRLSRKRKGRLDLAQGSFLETPFPRCDAIVATLALHHVASIKTKQKLYAKCFRALHSGGMLVSGDCFMAEHPRLAQRYLENWEAHMRRSYSAVEVKNFLAAWEQEDTYFSLRKELQMLTSVGFQVEVVWRRPPFAVVMGWKK